MAAPALQLKPLTFEEAARLNPDEFPGEIVEGEWVPMSRNTWEHAEIAGNVYAALRAYARSTPGWRVAVGDPGARLRPDPATLRGPDVALIRAERRPTGRGADGWLEGAPDLAVEIVGDSGSASETVRKGLEYLRAGSRMVWVVDPEPRLVIVLEGEGRIRIVGPDDTLDGGEVLPGFSCRVGEFFE